MGYEHVLFSDKIGRIYLMKEVSHDETRTFWFSR